MTKPSTTNNSDRLDEILRKLINFAVYEAADNSNGQYPVEEYRGADAKSEILQWINDGIKNKNPVLSERLSFDSYTKSEVCTLINGNINRVLQEIRNNLLKKGD